jgi:tRNA uridine 5-carboxymethylaminomethyl modification enzyme
VQEQAPWTPRRDEAYIGVLIDDLISRGTQEPYRMFTSRAEYRLLLREDNADFRLTPKAQELGLIDDKRWQRFEEKYAAIAQEKLRLENTLVRIDSPAAVKIAERFGQSLARESRILELLRRPELRYTDLMTIDELGPGIGDLEAAEQIEIQVKYAGYIDRQEEEIARSLRQETLKIPQDLNYTDIHGLSNETKQKLSNVRPETLGMASRIPGMTPAAISLLLVHLKKRYAS